MLPTLCWSKVWNFGNSRPSASNIKSFSWSQKHFFFSHNSSQQFWKKNTTSYPRLPHTQIHRPVLLTVIFSTSKSGVSVGINLMHLVSVPSSLSSLRTITQLSLKLQIKQRSSLIHIICLAVELPCEGILCF